MDKVKKFFQDKHGNVVLWQIPNTPLLLWLLFMVVASFTQGKTSDWFHVASTVSLAVWALLEIAYGTTPFRKLLGGVILLFVIINFVF